MSNLSKTILITGAAKGLGLEIAKKGLDRGYKIIGIGRKNSAEFLSLGKQKCKFIEFNLENVSDIPNLVKKINEISNNKIYALINNAATGLDGVLATQHASDISKVLKLNLESPITLTKYIVRRMIHNQEGRIVNISSIIAQTGYNGLSVYAATKAGLQGFSRSLSREVGKAGITVNCIAPGFMITNMTSKLKGKKLDSIKRRSPLGLADKFHVASAVIYLLEKDAEKISGTTITVDGGSTA
jgi:3-oxoacyl-[acyl-carrier protein] reductase